MENEYNAYCIFNLNPKPKFPNIYLLIPSPHTIINTDEKLKVIAQVEIICNNNKKQAC